MKKENFFIAQIGRTVGLNGDLKLHLHTDFPQQFLAGNSFNTTQGLLKIKSYNPKRGLIHFEGYDDVNRAKRLTNTKIYSDEEQTKEFCPLKEGEHYWFEIIGSSVKEKDSSLGMVKDIQRVLDIDYLIIETEAYLQDIGLAKSFLIPYIPRYILSFDSSTKTLYVQDSKDILEAS